MWLPKRDSFFIYLFVFITIYYTIINYLLFPLISFLINSCFLLYSFSLTYVSFFFLYIIIELSFFQVLCKFFQSLFTGPNMSNSVYPIEGHFRPLHVSVSNPNFGHYLRGIYCTMIEGVHRLTQPLPNIANTFSFLFHAIFGLNPHKSTKKIRT